MTDQGYSSLLPTLVSFHSWCKVVPWFQNFACGQKQKQKYKYSTPKINSPCSIWFFGRQITEQTHLIYVVPKSCCVTVNISSFHYFIIPLCISNVWTFITKTLASETWQDLNKTKMFKENIIWPAHPAGGVQTLHLLWTNQASVSMHYTPASFTNPHPSRTVQR